MLKFALVLIIFLPFTIYAQGFEPDLNNLPSPITDLWNTASKIRVNIEESSFFTRILETTVGVAQDPINFFSDLKNWWGNINNWFQDKVGLSFMEILRRVGNFFVWTLELFVKVIKFALSFI